LRQHRRHRALQDGTFVKHRNQHADRGDARPVAR
jgi:hypothetical protein